MSEKEKLDLGELAMSLDELGAAGALASGLVRSVEVHEQRVELMRQKLEQACQGESSGLVLQALGRELRRVAAVVKGPIDGLFVSVRGDVYVKLEEAKRDG